MADEQQTDEQQTDQQQTDEQQTVEQDFSWAPERFVKDGALDTEGFRTQFDELAAFHAREQERQAALPEKAEDIQMRFPEGVEMPEGVTLPEGHEMQLDPDDPDLPAFQKALFELGLDQAGADKLLGVLAIREARAISKMDADAAEEMKALGPDAEARKTILDRQIRSRLPEAQAQAILDGIHSADALRGLEALFVKGKPVIPDQGGKPNLGEMSIDERLELGLRQREQKRAG